MLSGFIVGLATAAMVTLLSVLFDPKTLRPMPNTPGRAFAVSAVVAIIIGVVFSQLPDRVFGNFLGMFLGYLAAQKLLIKKA